MESVEGSEQAPVAIKRASLDKGGKRGEEVWEASGEGGGECGGGEGREGAGDF
jgi:hypothetical protein